MKNEEIGKSVVSAQVWKEKHAMDHKPVLIKKNSKQTRMNLKGKDPYTKKKSNYKF